jgi:hypothetical protein
MGSLVTYRWLSNSICIWLRAVSEWLTVEQCPASELRPWKLHPTGLLSFDSCCCQTEVPEFFFHTYVCSCPFLFYSKKELRLFLLKNVRLQEHISLNTSHIEQRVCDTSFITSGIERQVWNTSLGISSNEHRVWHTSLNNPILSTECGIPAQ